MKKTKVWSNIQLTRSKMEFRSSSSVSWGDILRWFLSPTPAVTEAEAPSWDEFERRDDLLRGRRPLLLISSCHCRRNSSRSRSSCRDKDGICTKGNGLELCQGTSGVGVPVGVRVEVEEEESSSSPPPSSSRLPAPPTAAAVADGAAAAMPPWVAAPAPLDPNPKLVSCKRRSRERKR